MQILNTLIAEATAYQRYKIAYIKNMSAYDFYDSPRSREQIIESLENKLEEYKSCTNVKELMEATPNKEILIRTAMRRAYNQAEDFCENVWIRWSKLREVIHLKKLLIAQYPEAEQYSTRFLTNFQITYQN